MPGVIPVAVTTETIVRVVRESLGTDLVVWLPLHARVAYASRCVLVGLVVDRIVDARVCSCPPPHSYCAACAVEYGCGGGGCCLCWPISTGQLRTVTGLPLPAYQPSGLLGAYQDSNCLVETLS